MKFLKYSFYVGEAGEEATESPAVDIIETEATVGIRGSASDDEWREEQGL